jgi:uncharacterized membrane protein
MIPMGMTYVVHILAGTLGLVAGYVALYSAKGAALHRKSGMLFVYAMLFMAVFGMTIAVVRDKAPDINVPAGMITSYLVITALTTVRPPGAVARGWRWLDIGAMLVALVVGVIMLSVRHRSHRQRGQEERDAGVSIHPVRHVRVRRRCRRSPRATVGRAPGGRRGLHAICGACRSLFS